MLKKITLFFVVLVFSSSFSLSHGEGHLVFYGVAPGFKYLDSYTFISEKNLWKGIPSLDEDGRVNVVVEIPAGRTEKWEIRKEDGALVWNFKKANQEF